MVHPLIFPPSLKLRVLSLHQSLMLGVTWAVWRWWGSKRNHLIHKTKTDSTEVISCNCSIRGFPKALCHYTFKGKTKHLLTWILPLQYRGQMQHHHTFSSYWLQSRQIKPCPDRIIPPSQSWEPRAMPSGYRGSHLCHCSPAGCANSLFPKIISCQFTCKQALTKLPQVGAAQIQSTSQSLLQPAEHQCLATEMSHSAQHNPSQQECKASLGWVISFFTPAQLCLEKSILGFHGVIKWTVEATK